MPLQAVNFVPNTGNIKAADMLQFFQLFTGVMTDQPVTFPNTLTVGGSQSVGATPLRVGGVALQTANMVELRTISTDAQPALSISKAGAISVGQGGAVAPDLTLSRSGVGQLTVTGTVVISGGIGVSALNVSAGFVQMGTNPGGAGIFRIPNNTFIDWRNQPNSNDHAIGFDNNDRLLIQPNLTTQFTFTSTGGLGIGNLAGAPATGLVIVGTQSAAPGSGVALGFNNAGLGNGAVTNMTAPLHGTGTGPANPTQVSFWWQVGWNTGLAYIPMMQ